MQNRTAAPELRATPRLGLCGFTMTVEDYPLFFDMVEVQQTFYQPPRDGTMLGWVAATPRGFEFTVKAWQLVTHPASSPTYRRTKRPLSPQERVEAGGFQDTAIVAEGYARTLQCAKLVGATAVLFQCPASFGPDPANVDRMRAFFRRVERPNGIGLLWEPRGPKWIAERALAHALCDELDLVHVVDPFVTPPDPGRRVYWRLHGIGGARHSYSDAELDALAKMLRDVTAGAAGEAAYVLFNNLPRVGDAKRFRKRLAQK